MARGESPPHPSPRPRPRATRLSSCPSGLGSEVVVGHDLDSRRSHTGYILMLSGGAVSWKSRQQDCVSISTSEAEYVAASQCGQEVVYLREILGDFGFPPTGPTRVYEDNLACVTM